MLPTFEIDYIHPDSPMVESVREVGPTRTGRRVTLLLMEGAEITFVREV